MEQLFDWVSKFGYAGLFGLMVGATAAGLLGWWLAHQGQGKGVSMSEAAQNRGGPEW